jgi:hypothetical protein
MLAPPAGSLPLPGWPRGHCRYPEDRVPSHISSKSRQRARQVLTRVHVSRDSSSRSLAQGRFRATMCPVAPAPASWLRAATGQPCVPRLQLPPPGSGSLQSHHVSRGSSSHLLAQGSSGDATCPMKLYGLWTIEVNKYPLAV